MSEQHVWEKILSWIEKTRTEERAAQAAVINTSGTPGDAEEKKIQIWEIRERRLYDLLDTLHERRNVGKKALELTQKSLTRKDSRMLWKARIGKINAEIADLRKDYISFRAQRRIETLKMELLILRNEETGRKLLRVCENQIARVRRMMFKLRQFSEIAEEYPFRRTTANRLVRARYECEQRDWQFIAVPWDAEQYQESIIATLGTREKVRESFLNALRRAGIRSLIPKDQLLDILRGIVKLSEEIYPVLETQNSWRVLKGSINVSLFDTPMEIEVKIFISIPEGEKKLFFTMIP